MLKAVSKYWILLRNINFLHHRKILNCFKPISITKYRDVHARFEHCACMYAHIARKMILGSSLIPL